MSNEIEHSSGIARRGAVAVVVRQGRLLVIRRSATVAAPRMFCFPGGGIHPGETEAQALVREIQEELGATIRPIERLWRSVTPWNVELFWWRGELADDQPLVPDPAEVESVHWYTPDEMLALDALLESNRLFIQAIRDGQFALDLDEGTED